MPETRNPTLREQYPNARVVDHITISGEQLGQCCVSGCDRLASRNLRQGEATGPVVSVVCQTHSSELLTTGRLVTGRNRYSEGGEAVIDEVFIYGTNAGVPVGVKQEKKPKGQLRVFQIRRIDPLSPADNRRVCHCGEDAKVWAHDPVVTPFPLCWGCSKALQAGEDIEVNERWRLHWAGIEAKKSPPEVVSVTLKQSIRGPTHCCVDGCVEEPGCYKTKEGWRLCRFHTVSLYLYGELDLKTGTIFRWAGSRQGAIFLRVMERNVYRWADVVQRRMLDETKIIKEDIKKTEYKPETETKLTKDDLLAYEKPVKAAIGLLNKPPEGYTEGTPEGSGVRVFITDEKKMHKALLCDDKTIQEALMFHEEVLGTLGHRDVDCQVFIEWGRFRVRYRRANDIFGEVSFLRTSKVYIVRVLKKRTLSIDTNKAAALVGGNGDTLEVALEGAREKAALLASHITRHLEYQGNKCQGPSLTYRSLKR
jgi:hypothetical protein